MSGSAENQQPAPLAAMLDQSLPPLSVTWLRKDMCRHYLFLLLCIISLGTFYGLCVLFPKWRVALEYVECAAEVATAAIVTVDPAAGAEPGEVMRFDSFGETIIVLEIKCHRYACSKGATDWQLYPVATAPLNFASLLGDVSAMPSASRDLMRAIFGENNMQLPRTSVVEILARQMVHPFYIFQYFSVAVWCADEYYIYSAVIFLTTVGAIYVATKEMAFNLERLRDLAGRDVEVYRCSEDGCFSLVPGRTLLPGDRYAIVPGKPIPCDTVLSTGRVAVDESMLTGESVPITKVPLDLSVLENPLSEKKTSRAPVDLSIKYSGSILFSGTKVIQTSGGVTFSAADTADGSLTCPIGVVYKTGFRSAKGVLVASLLNPKEELMGFISDALMVIMVMFFLATAMYIWTAVSLKRNGLPDDRIFLAYLDALTIAIPPALTASLSVATSISVQRLGAKMISVSETSRINWAGSVSVVCFDKTGTLTEDRLVFEKVLVPSSVHDDKSSGFESFGPVASDLPKQCIELMATCHSLSFIDGVGAGDALEVELLRAIGWTALPPGLSSSKSASAEHTLMVPCDSAAAVDSLSSEVTSPVRAAARGDVGEMLTILRHFEFSADKMRSTSLIKRHSGEILLYVKGSPEVLESLVNKSTVPGNFSHVLHAEVRRGHRVIAMAFHSFGADCNEASIMSMSQLDLETNFGLEFLGLISLSNGLKADTISTITSLKNASIHCSMITGDHAHTAIAVAESCGLLNESKPLYYLDVMEEESKSAIAPSPPISPPASPISNPASFAVEPSNAPILVESSVSPLVLMNRDGEKWGISIEDFLRMLVDQNTTEDGFTTLQLVMNGKSLVALQKEHPRGMLVFLRYCRVFARMKPTDKQFIVRSLIENESVGVISSFLRDGETDISCGVHLRSGLFTLKESLLSAESQLDSAENGDVADGKNFQAEGKIMEPLQVMFCGDGANDMSALREATVGVSLCEAETSVAAPVTSRLQTPGAVIDVLKEGRCSLITAYVLISFNVMYAVIQLFMVCNMYKIGLKIGDATYLIQDLFFTLILGLAISLTPPSDVLSTERPPAKFLNAVYTFKLSSQMLCFIAFQLLALEALKAESFYDAYELDDDEDPLSETYSDETSVISAMGLAQVLIASVVSTIGHPFRVRWYQNPYHVACLIFQSGFILYQLFARRNYFLRHLLVIKPLPYHFCFILMAIMAMNGIACGIIDVIGDYIGKSYFGKSASVKGTTGGAKKSAISAR